MRAPDPSVAAEDPSTKWREDYCFLCFGSVTPVCVGAWVLFMLVPILFFILVGPGLVILLGETPVMVGLYMYALTALFFLLAACANPGVPSREAVGSPPPIEYVHSKDSSRYVRKLDHFCDFVGNDIGGDNLGCFVLFLISLAIFSTYLLACCVLYTVLMYSPPRPALQFAPLSLWWGLALLLMAAVISALIKCSREDCCDGVLPLIMMIPGARCGMTLLALVCVAVVVLPCITNLWSHVSLERNPAAFYFVLPLLAFSVLFCGMSAHWIWLLSDGLSQRLWLKAKGWGRFGFKKSSDPQGTAMM